MSKCFFYPATVGPVRMTITPAIAKKLALNEVECGILPATAVTARVGQIQRQWKEALADKRTTLTARARPPWDKHGSLPGAVANDPDYVPLSDLEHWLKEQTKGQRPSGGKDEEIRRELTSIVRCCKDLANPNHLWGIPLLMVYPVVTEHKNIAARASKKAKKEETTSTYTLRIAVYCHRMLAEATTLSLRAVMDALDDDSFIVTQPLMESSMPEERTFESSMYPIVCIKDKDLASKTEKENTVPEDERKMPAKKHDQDDVWSGKDSGRDDSCVSAFTTKGLLKLMENHGTDVSDYESTIAPHLDSFQVKLMLHQKHAIVWMLQMEHLEGFGLNSIFWEECEFLDGGKYYYSPRLGQLRLDRPANMKGGLLCDEMGLVS
jgi:hypothetical protein